MADIACRDVAAREGGPQFVECAVHLVEAICRDDAAGTGEQACVRRAGCSSIVQKYKWLGGGKPMHRAFHAKVRRVALGVGERGGETTAKKLQNPVGGLISATMTNQNQLQDVLIPVNAFQ